MTRQFVDLKSLPKNQVCVLIARDVLEQLRLGKIISISGVYFKVYPPNFQGVDLLHEILENSPCMVCALGALYYSRVQIANGLICEGALNDNGTLINNWRVELEEYFGKGQVRSIERYFEGWYETLAENFVYANPDPEIRMAKIMQNIIDNDGTFIPEKL